MCSAWALNENLAFTKRKRENGELDDISNLLDIVLERENMLIAMKRVISNKGSHGVDGMESMNFERLLLAAIYKN